MKSTTKRFVPILEQLESRLVPTQIVLTWSPIQNDPLPEWDWLSYHLQSNWVHFDGSRDSAFPINGAVNTFVAMFNGNGPCRIDATFGAGTNPTIDELRTGVSWNSHLDIWKPNSLTIVNSGVNTGLLQSGFSIQGVSGTGTGNGPITIQGSTNSRVTDTGFNFNTNGTTSVASAKSVLNVNGSAYLTFDMSSNNIYSFDDIVMTNTPQVTVKNANTTNDLTMINDSSILMTDPNNGPTLAFSNDNSGGVNHFNYSGNSSYGSIKIETTSGSPALGLIDVYGSCNPADVIGLNIVNDGGEIIIDSLNSSTGAGGSLLVSLGDPTKYSVVNESGGLLKIDSGGTIGTQYGYNQTAGPGPGSPETDVNISSYTGDTGTGTIEGPVIAGSGYIGFLNTTSALPGVLSIANFTPSIKGTLKIGNGLTLGNTSRGHPSQFYIYADANGNVTGVSNINVVDQVTLGTPHMAVTFFVNVITGGSGNPPPNTVTPNWLTWGSVSGPGNPQVTGAIGNNHWVSNSAANGYDYLEVAGPPTIPAPLLAYASKKQKDAIDALFA